MNWHDRAEAQLEEDYASMFITYQEYLQGMRDLRAEMEQCRQDDERRAEYPENY